MKQGDFPYSHVNVSQMVNSIQFPWNHHFPMVFQWFSLWFSNAITIFPWLTPFWTTWNPSGTSLETTYCLAELRVNPWNSAHNLAPASAVETSPGTSKMMNLLEAGWMIYGFFWWMNSWCIVINGDLYLWLVVWTMTLIFPYTGNNHPNWLIFFRRVETTN